MLTYYFVFCFICFVGILTDHLVNEGKDGIGIIFMLILVASLTPIFNLVWLIISLRNLHVQDKDKHERTGTG